LVDGLTPAIVAEILTRLTMPEREAEFIRAGHGAPAVVLRQLSKRPALKPSEVYRALTGLGNEAVVFLLAKAGTPSIRRQLSTYLTSYQYITPLLTGTDLKAFGLKPGPLFKKILDRLLDARLDGEVHTDAEERALAKELIRSELLPGAQLALSWR
jgi:tRNA nucleotidyltransferase (CCA-adding enzyme)